MISMTGSRIVGGCLASLVVAAFAACGGSQGVGSKYVKTASVGAAGGTITITASDDATIAGTTITIPPHALTTDTTISIGVSAVDVAKRAPSHSIVGGPVIDFEPSGTTFAVPVTVTIPAAGGVSASDSYVEAVEGSDGTGSASRIAAEFSGGLATFHANGFTSFGVVTTPTDGGPACATDSDCPTGDVCVSSACTPGTTVTPDSGTACTVDSDCPIREACIAGVCSIPTATDGGSPEGGGCGDGVCSGGETCASCPADCGACDGGPLDGGAADAIVCPGGETDCSGTCADLTTDPAHCGACGVRCPTGICTSSKCS
jgi:hypothetical protein